MESTNFFTRGFFGNPMESIYLVRVILEKANSFEEAIEMAKTTEIGATAFYIIGGVSDNEGCVVERNTSSVHNFYCLDDDTTWYLVQTNWDKNYTGKDDDGRKAAAVAMMDSIGQQNINLKTMMDEVLSVPPVFVTKDANLQFETISSSVMKND